MIWTRHRLTAHQNEHTLLQRSLTTATAEKLQRRVYCGSPERAELPVKRQPNHSQPTGNTRVKWGARNRRLLCGRRWRSAWKGTARDKRNLARKWGGGAEIYLQWTRLISFFTVQGLIGLPVYCVMSTRQQCNNVGGLHCNHQHTCRLHTGPTRTVLEN